MPVPLSLSRWLASAYPTLNVEPQWLEDCHAYITTTFPDQSAQQTIKSVEAQLLLSNLSDSIASPGPLSLLHSDNEEDLYDLSTTRGVLLQITSITDIGQSAISLRDAQTKRLEERKGGPAIVGNVEGEEASSDGPTKFPRGMLAVEMSDGYETLRGMEYGRLNELELGEVCLGAKVVLKGCRVRRGMALLTPATVVYKGHRVEEMEENADQAFEDGIKARIDNQGERRAPLQPRPSARQGSTTAKAKAKARQPAPAPPPRQAIDLDTTLEDDDFDMEDDFALFDAVDQAEQIALDVKRSQQRAPQLDVESDEELWAGLDEEDMDADEVWRVDEQEVQAKPAKRKKAPSVISLSSE